METTQQKALRMACESRACISGERMLFGSRPCMVCSGLLV